MRFTTVLCSVILLLTAFNATLWAFSGFNLVYFLVFKNSLIYRILTALSGVAALWHIFWLVTFRPLDSLQ